MRDIADSQEFQIFQFNGKFGQFAFYTSRPNAFEVFARYLVHTKIAPKIKGRNLHPEANHALIRVHAKCIESALFHFLSGRMFGYKPVKEVLINISDNPDTSQFAWEDDILS